MTKSFEITTHVNSGTSTSGVGLPLREYCKFTKSSPGFVAVSAEQFFSDLATNDVPISVSEMTILTNVGDLITSSMSQTVLVDTTNALDNYVLTVNNNSPKGISWMPAGNIGDIVLANTILCPQLFILPPITSGANAYLQLVTNHSNTATIKFPIGAIALSPGNSTALLICGSGWNCVSPSGTSIFPTTVQNKLVASLANSTQAQFGISLAISGDGSMMIVGAPGYTSILPNSGAIFTFFRNLAGDWISDGTALQESPPVTNNGFGVILKLSKNGKVLVVSCIPDKNIVKVFTYNNGWNYETTLNVPGIVWSDQYGRSLDINNNGDIIAVGAPGKDNNKGSVFLWTKNATWGYVEITTIVGCSYIPTDNYRFGESVALNLDGNMLAIGVPGHEIALNNYGAAYITNNINFGVKLDQLGSNITSISMGTNIVFSSDGNTIAITSIVGVYVFSRKYETWYLHSTITNSLGSQFVSLDINADGNTLILGDPSVNNNKGAVSVFSRVNENWVEHNSRLSAGNVTDSNSLGTSVAISSSGAIMMAGAPFDIINSCMNGEVWSFI